MSRVQVLTVVGFVVLSIGFANSATARTTEPVRSSSKASAPVSGASYDVLQFDYDAQHSGDDTLETAISVTNVASLRKVFQVSFPNTVDGAPMYLSAVSTPTGAQDLLFVNTKAGQIIALNAHTGAQVWTHQYPAGACVFGTPPVRCYTPSSPAVDPNRQYVYAYGLDAKVHKYQVGDGTEITGNGWPEPTSAKMVNGTPMVEKVTSNLSIATAKNGTSYLYVGHSSKDDGPADYQGHLTTINLADGTQHVFNDVCSNQVDVYFVLAPGTPDCATVQSGIWARSGAVYLPDTDRIFVATGNGLFDPTNYYWGYSVFSLNPDGTGSSTTPGVPLDSYTVPDWNSLKDADLGSTAPAILPTPANSNVKHLAVQGGKEGILRLLNLDNLSGQGGPGFTGGEVFSMTVPMTGETLTAPAVWVDPADGTTWCFYTNANGLAALRLAVDASGNPSLQTMWQTTPGGSSPIIANNILFVATSNLIRAMDPVTGNLLWSDTTIAGIHFESPMVANGMLFITDESRELNAYALFQPSVFLPLIEK